MNYTVFRNNERFLVKLQDLKSNDFVLSQDGQFYPASSFAELRDYFPQFKPPTFSEILSGIGQTILITAGIIGVVILIDDMLSPQYNAQPLTQKTRDFIRERDEEICFYCDEYVSNGHVDHRKSRANGGSNDFDNLTWACPPCNWSKGPLDDYEFIQLLEYNQSFA